MGSSDASDRAGKVQQDEAFPLAPGRPSDQDISPQNTFSGRDLGLQQTTGNSANTMDRARRAHYYGSLSAGKESKVAKPSASAAGQNFTSRRLPARRRDHDAEEQQIAELLRQ